MATEVKVDFIGQFRELAGASQVIISFEGRPTLEDVVRKLIGMFGERFENMVLEAGQLSENVIVLLNGRSIRPSDMRSVILGHGDDLVFAPESAP